MKLKVLVVFIALLSTQAMADGYHRYVVAMRSFEDWRRVVKENDQPTFFPQISSLALELTDGEAQELRKSPKVRYVSQEVFRYISATPDFTPGQFWQKQSVPWGIAAIHAPEAQRFGQGEGVGVVVMDSGVDCENPDLKGHCGGGYDFVNKKEVVVDDNGHGTHVAGTIAASDNEQGLVGVAPRANIIPLKVLAADGKGSGMDILSACSWVLDHKDQYNIKAVNMSFGSPDPWQPEQEIIKKLEAAGIMVVAASGNESAPAPDYPGAYASLDVGAVDEFLKVADFSNSLPNITAPGVYVASTFLRSKGLWGWVSLPDGSDILAEPLAFSPAASAQATLKNCGIGNPSEFPQSQFTEDYVALISRGEISFAQKTTNSVAAKAKAEIIFNNVPGTLIGTLGNVSVFWTIPAVTVSQKDGKKLLSFVGQSISVGTGYCDYTHSSGTSMATPHVTGAVALLFSAFPGITAGDVKYALISSATDIGTPGYDPQSGSGFLNVFNAALYIQNVINGVPRRRSTHH